MKNKPVKDFASHLKGLDRSQRELEKRIFHLKTLYDVSQEIGFLKSTHEIMKNLLMMIIGTFGALSGVILLINIKDGKVEDSTQRGMDTSSTDKLVRNIESRYFDETKEVTDIMIIGGKSEENKRRKKSFFDLLNSLKVNIWIPFKVNENFIGGIGLGGKLSGDQYSADDQELLSTLAYQGAVAIENAKLIEQMKKEEVMRTNLVRYLSPHVVEQIIENNVQVNMGGDRKVVTVLFSDIRDFTRISESLPPNQLVQILNEYFNEMAKIIFKFRGSLDKYFGDAIVAVFGSLIPLENSAQNAIKTAVQMMKHMPLLNEKWKDKYGFTMNIGIGVSSGEVFIGNIGSPARMEFTVLGDTVNVASRLSGLAKTGQILITKETLSCLDSDIHCKGFPSTQVKGRRGKLEILELLYV